MKNIVLYLIFFISLIFFVSKVVASDLYHSNELILKVHPDYRYLCSEKGIADEEIKSLFDKIEVKEIRRVFKNKPIYTKNLVPNNNLGLIYKVYYKSKIKVPEVVRILKTFKFIKYAQPSYKQQLFARPNDPLAVDQYSLRIIGAFSAFDNVVSNPNITIGIVDAGFSFTHEDIVGKVKIDANELLDGIDNDNDGYIDNYRGWDVANNDNNVILTSNTTRHALAVSSLAIASTNNAKGMASVGYNAKFLPVNIGKATSGLANPYEGVVYAADHGCDIINCSWGGNDIGIYEKEVLDYVINIKGKVVVAATGNDGDRKVFYPAAVDGVLSVYSADSHKTVSSFSNIGYKALLGAPGEKVYIASRNNNYIKSRGTSFAAPIVSGALALLKSKYTSLTYHQLAEMLKYYTNPVAEMAGNKGINTDYLGHGLINLERPITQGIPTTWANIKTIKFKDNKYSYRVNDTIVAKVVVKNYFDAINNVVVSLSPLNSTTNNYEITPIGLATKTVALAKNQEKDIEFKLLAKRINVNTDINLKATVSFNSITNKNYKKIILDINSQEYISTGDLTTLITNYGSFGRFFNNTREGFFGIQYKGKELVNLSGLILIDRNKMFHKGVNRDIYPPDIRYNYFTSVAPVRVETPPAGKPVTNILSTNYINRNFPTIADVAPDDIIIQHRAFADTNAINKKIILLSYTLVNITQNNTYNYRKFRFGIYTDWKLSKFGFDDRIYYSVSDTFSYVFQKDAKFCAAIIPLEPSGATQHAVALDKNVPGEFDFSESFSHLNVYDAMSVRRDTSYFMDFHKVAQFSSYYIRDLQPQSSKSFSFAIVVGDNLNDLKKNVKQAKLLKKKIGKLSVHDNSKLPILNASIFPNPVGNQLRIKYSFTPSRVIIIGPMGRVIADYNRSIEVLPTTKWSKGIYFIKIFNTDGRFLIKKVIK